MKKSRTFLNASDLVFTDISSESKREYVFPNGNILKIKKPKFLNVSPSGGHRLYSEDGWSYYIKPEDSWWIRWKVCQGMPNFVK